MAVTGGCLIIITFTVNILVETKLWDLDTEVNTSFLANGNSYYNVVCTIYVRALSRIFLTCRRFNVIKSTNLVTE